MTGAPPPCGTRFARLVDRAFVGDLPRWRRRGLRRHLASCDGCRKRHDRLAAIDRSLGAGRALGEPAIAAIGDAVLAGATPWLRRRSVWVGVGAVATAAAVLLALSLGDDQRPEFRERGDGIPLGDRGPGVRLFCVDVDGAAPRVVAESRVADVAGPVLSLRCTIGDELQLAYSTPDQEGLTMVAFGRRGQSIHTYAPRAGETEAVALAPDRIDEPLDWSIRLGVNHQPGDHEIIVRVFDRPVSAAAAIAGEVAPIVELRGRLEIAEGGAR